MSKSSISESIIDLYNNAYIIEYSGQINYLLSTFPVNLYITKRHIEDKLEICFISKFTDNEFEMLFTYLKNNYINNGESLLLNFYDTSNLTNNFLNNLEKFILHNLKIWMGINIKYSTNINFENIKQMTDNLNLTYIIIECGSYCSLIR